MHFSCCVYKRHFPTTCSWILNTCAAVCCAKSCYVVGTPVTGCPLSKLLPFIVLYGMFVVACLQTCCASCFDGMWLSWAAVTLGFTFIPSFVAAQLTCHSLPVQWKVPIARILLLNPLMLGGNFMYRQFKTQQFYFLPTRCIYVFCVDLRTNRDYSSIQL